MRRFRVRTPQTPLQQSVYHQAPSFQLLHGRMNGQSFYAFKDWTKGIAYVGGRVDYQRYLELSSQERLGRVDYEENTMPGQMAAGWYDVWAGRGGLAAGPLADAINE